MEPKGSLPHSQMPVNYTYLEPGQAVNVPQFHFLNIRFNIILPSTSESFK
jgi:hypothetical protein